MLWDISTGVVQKAASVDRPVDMIRALPDLTETGARSFVTIGGGMLSFCSISGTDLLVEDIELAGAAPQGAGAFSSPTHSISLISGMSGALK
eukprot:COSAG05_NODE_1346_length_5126_cov_12.771434_2_plen_92_part_00